MGIFHAHQDACEDGILEGLLEFELIVFELFADEADCENGDFLDCEVLAGDVLGDFLDDARPLPARHLNAADGCDYLD